MDLIHPHVTITMVIGFLVLVPSGTEAQQICSARAVEEFSENNTVGAVVANITTQEGVTLAFKNPVGPDYPFSIRENQLIAVKVLDYEGSPPTYQVELLCKQQPSGKEFPLEITVVLKDVNDNPPQFAQALYKLNVSELSPVGTEAGTISATDLDPTSRLYYTLTPASKRSTVQISGRFRPLKADFKLETSSSGKILVDALLDYERVRNVQLTLVVQDTPLPPEDIKPSFTASTTILVTIIDIDNRPPWFQPCTKHEVGGAMICQNAGYTGNVELNKKETGVLPLKPGPLYAIDGDESINAKIMYSFVSGNPGNLFDIDPNSGNITMSKAADALGSIILTVLAAQQDNRHQFATTTVIISVLVESLHPPRFEKQQYDGVIAASGTMVMDVNEEQPVKVLATDDDYIGAGGVNPNIIYSITGSNDFSIINGYIFMTRNLPASTLSLQVKAVDESNGESATVPLSVEVTPGLTSTTVLPSTTDITSTTPTGETSISVSTTDPSVSTTDPSASTTDPSASTTDPSASTTDPSASTTDPSASTNGSVSTANPSTTNGGAGHTGEYRTEDMMAVGITLGVLLLISLVVIGLLVYQIRTGKMNWKKVYEANVFRSTLGQGHKGGIQYTNESFYKEEDGGSVASSGQDGGGVQSGGEFRMDAGNFSLQESAVRSAASLHTFLPDDDSQAGSDKTDSEKEVKPILTKERRLEEGYKSVWFKEDIDPNAKQEVVIIPDSREDDADEDEDWEDGIEQNVTKQMPKVAFSDTDLDSGLGLKMEDHMDDSEDNESL